MVVKQIVRYCEDPANGLAEEVDLVAVAKQQNGIQLLVDGTAFEIFLTQKFLTGLCVDSDNTALHLATIGGDYALLRQKLESFVRVLSEAKIELIWIYDGAKGASSSDLAVRRDTWLERMTERLELTNKTIRFYGGGRPSSQSSTPSYDRSKYASRPANPSSGNEPARNDWRTLEATPRLFKQEFRAVLRDLYGKNAKVRQQESASESQRIGGDVMQCVVGEADIQIAKRFYEDNRDSSKKMKPFAVLSNNSDFAVFKGCSFIPSYTHGEKMHFDVGNDLELDSIEPFSRAKSSGLKHLRCLVVNADKLLNHLGLRDHNQLADVAFLCGNTFSNPLFNNFGKAKKANLLDHWTFGNNKFRRVEDCADFIRNRGDLLTAPELQSKFRLNSKIPEAIRLSRAYFNLQLDAIDDHEVGAHECEEDKALLLKKIGEFAYAPELLSVYYGTFWKPISLEDLVSSNRPKLPIAQLLTPLRKILYRIVSPKDLVMEIGLNDDLELAECWRAVATSSDFELIESLPFFSQIDADDETSNREYFELVLTHAEDKQSDRELPSYFNLVKPTRNAAACYLLRYFLVLNWQRNLEISEGQFYALCCSLLATKEGKTSDDGDGDADADVDLQWYARLTMKPDARCLTIMEWSQEIYWFFFYVFGRLFHLEKLCPKPSELFSGSLFSAFYLATEAVESSSYCGRINDYDRVIGKIKSDMSRVFKKYDREIKAIVNEEFAVVEPLLFAAASQ